MKIRHYFHVYAAGAWSAPVRDHIVALGRAGLDDMAWTVGLVGPEEDRKACREIIELRCEKWVLPQPENWVEADQAHEHLTLNQIHQDVHSIPGEFAVLYTHGKGAARNSDDNASWRRAMTGKVVGDWEHCIELLEQGYDAVGPHWMTQFGDWFFGGNFWWAKASHLRKLPPPESKEAGAQDENAVCGLPSRWSPEIWVSLPACPNRNKGMMPMKIVSLIEGPPAYGD